MVPFGLLLSDPVQWDQPHLPVVYRVTYRGSPRLRQGFMTGAKYLTMSISATLLIHFDNHLDLNGDAVR